MTLPEFIIKTVYEWDQWSPAERRNLDAIVDEVIQYASDGTGNAFIARFWVNVVVPKLNEAERRIHGESFTVGDQVRFHEVLEPGDESARFDVIEDNGDRLLVCLVCDLPIRPTQIVRRADVCKVD